MRDRISLRQTLLACLWSVVAAGALAVWPLGLVRYHGTEIVPLSVKRTLVYEAGLLFAGAAGTVFLRQLTRQPKYAEERLPFRKTVRRVLLPLLISFWLAGSAAICPLALFGRDTVNRAFLEAGLTLLCVFAGTLVFLWREKPALVLSETGLRNGLQCLCISGALWYCVRYQNALSEYEHYVATRGMLLFLALAALCMLPRAALFSLKNILYLAGMLPVDALYYYRSIKNWGDPVLAKQNAALATLTGFLLWQLARRLLSLRQAGKKAREGEKKKVVRRHYPSPCAIVLFLYAVCVLRYANGRIWPIALLIVYALFYAYLRLFSGESKITWLRNVSGGILLSFLYVVTDSLLHRPWHYFIYYRYPMSFHTVTMTAVYLTLVTTGAAVLLISVTEEAESKRASILEKHRMIFPKELLAWGLFGVSLSYLFMTLSRNGYASAAGTLVFLLLLYAVRKGIKKSLRKAALFLAAFLFCFPATFTVVRIVPALVNQPFVFSIEPFSESIEPGEPWDSARYMTIGRFFETLGFKLHGAVEIADTGARVYVAAADKKAAVRAAEPESLRVSSLDQYTNGRLDIYRAYLGQLNVEGHTVMGAVMPDGSLALHAHNIYLQIAFDHGIITGIVFVLVCFFALRYAAAYYTGGMRLLPFSLLVAFMIVGMAELVWHLCNPLACGMLLSIYPALFDRNEGNKNEKQSV